MTLQWNHETGQHSEFEPLTTVSCGDISLSLVAYLLRYGLVDNPSTRSARSVLYNIKEIGLLFVDVMTSRRNSVLARASVRIVLLPGVASTLYGATCFLFFCLWSQFFTSSYKHRQCYPNWIIQNFGADENFIAVVENKLVCSY